MKPRHLQGNNPQKRTLATINKTNRPNKRLQKTSDSSTPPKPPSNALDLSDGGANDISPRLQREGQSPSPRGTNGHSQPVPTVLATVSNINGVALSARPDVCTNTEIGHGTLPGMLDMLKASEQRILRHVIAQQRILLSRIDTIEGTLKEFPQSIADVKSGVATLKAMLLTGGNKDTSQHNSTRPRNRTRTTKLEDEIVDSCPTLPTELKIVFNTDIACLAAAKALGAQMAKFHRTRDTVSVSARAMHVFIYSPKSRLGKNANKDGIGFRHSEFRFKVARIMVELSRGIPEHVFFEAVGNHSPEGVQSGNGALPANSRPSWLSSDFVDAGSMLLARKQFECFASVLPKDPTDPLKRKALYTVKRFFKVVVDMLRDARDRCKTNMFEGGLFCFLNWEGSYWFPKDLHKPLLIFLDPMAEVTTPPLISECALGHADAVRATNIELLNSLISERKEMILEATYSVFVSKETTWKARKTDPNKEKKTLTRHINILRIAKSFMCGFCHLSEEDLLRVHLAMLQNLYRFASVLRDIFLKHIPLANRYVRPVKPRSARRDRFRTSSEGEAPSVKGSVRGHSRSASNRTQNGGNFQTREDEERSNEVQEASEDRDANGCTDPADGNHRKETPPITMADLFPAESEADRILDNYIELSVEAYNRINVVTYDDIEIGVPERNGVPDEGSDSGNDGMSDMMGDED